MKAEMMDCLLAACLVEKSDNLKGKMTDCLTALSSVEQTDALMAA